MAANADTGFALWFLQAEAAYWQRSEGYKVGWSDELLGFDCGGQQWVLEAAFPTGTLRHGARSTLLMLLETCRRSPGGHAEHQTPHNVSSTCV